MVDNVDRETRSRIMACIKGQDTRPEMIVRSGLHRRGFRFRLNQRYPYVLNGKRRSTKPDLVLKKYRTVILVNSCFWHWHEGCRYAVLPGTSRDYWKAKLAETRARDIRNRNYWLTRGWYVAIVWECTMRDRSDRDVDTMLQRLADWITRTSYRRRAADFSG